MPSLRRTLLLAAAALLMLPAAAQADSIVYIDGGDVWSAAPDGSHKVRLTDGGNWHSPTQADDGTVAAVQGTGPIQVMAPDGRPLRSIVTPPAATSNGGTFAPRPVNLSFSPDGSKLAYSYAADTCPVASSCGARSSTFYTHADVTEATPIATYGNQFNVGDPEWVTNARTLVFGGYGSQVSIDDLGPGDYSHTAWMTPNTDQGDGEVSRDGRHLVTTYSYGEDLTLAFFAVNGDVRTQTPPAEPDLACTLTAPDPQLRDPSWSPDGMGIAIQSSEGIEIGRFTTLEANECETTGAFAVLTPTGSTPDWGPADPPAKRWTPPAPAPGPLAFVGTVKATRRALAGGLAVRVRVPQAGELSATLSAGKRAIARGTSSAAAPGVVTLRLSRVKLLRKPARLKLSVTQGAATVSKRLKVR